VIKINHELELLNAIIDNDGVNECLQQNMEDIFVEHGGVWSWVHDYHFKYSKAPSKKIIKEHFDEFEYIDTSDAPLQYYIDNAKQHALGRNVKATLSDAIALFKDSGANATLSFLASNSHKLMRFSGALKDTDLVRDYNDRVENFRLRVESDDHKLLGIPSGISVIDECFGGWQGGDFVIVMGWSAVGKSSLTRLFAVNAWRLGYSPLIISLEMNKYQEGYRLDTILNSGESFTNDQLTHARGLSPEEYEEWAVETFKGKPPI